MEIYICVSWWLLAHESRDLSQAETKKVLLKAEQIHKLTQNDDFFSNLTILSGKGSFAQLEINHVIHEPTANK